MTISHVFMITVQVKNQLHITTKLTLNKEDFDHEYTCPVKKAWIVHEYLVTLKHIKRKFFHQYLNDIFALRNSTNVHVCNYESLIGLFLKMFKNI